MTKGIGMGVGNFGLAVLLAVSGCSSGGSDGGGPASVYNGTGTPGQTGTTGTGDPGTTGTTGTGDPGATGTTGTGDPGTTDPTVTDPTGTVTDPTTGTAGTGATDPVIDSTTFLDCVSGIQNWGTELQAGPCGSTVTRYGEMIEFGPYGASMEYNVGQGFEVPIAAGDNDGGFTCSLFVATFAADPVASAELQMTMDLDFALHTVFYPGVMPEGEKFPLITWGNGTCAMPEGYGALLRYVASFGYIVVAPNSRWVGSGAAQKIGLDFMFAANEDPTSKYYQKIDTDKVGAMGHSQGGGGTAMAATDSRIKAVILFNGGTTASKPFFSISGERDIGGVTVSQLSNPVSIAAKAAYMYFHMIPTMVTDTMGNTSTTGGSAGHLTLMMQPERVVEATVAWWDVLLHNDTVAREMFVGDTCGLCNRAAEFDFGQNGL